MARDAKLGRRTAPALRDGTQDDVYLLSDDGDGHVAVRCRRRDGTLDELTRTPSGRRGLNRVTLAQAILRDALESPPPRLLVRDYARFVPLPGAQAVRLPAHELDAWLATWEPAITAILRRLS